MMTLSGTVNLTQISPGQGTDVGAATALPLPPMGNYFRVTGNTAITSMTPPGGASSRPYGMIVYLRFAGTPVLNQTSGNANEFKLAGSASINPITAGTVMGFIYGTESNGQWNEISRVVP